MNQLSLKNSFEQALRKIDTMRRLSEQKRLWIVVASDDRPPVHGDAKEQAQHHEEVDALLHYARIGLHASHDKLR